MTGMIVIFLIKDTKLTSHIDKISEHINSLNEKNHSHVPMGKMIVNLINKKCKKHNNSTGHFNNIQRFFINEYS